MRRMLAIGALSFATVACTTVDPDRGDPDVLSAGLEAQMNRYVQRIQAGNRETLQWDLTHLSAFGRYASERVGDDLLTSKNPRVRSNAVFVLSEIYRMDGDPQALDLIRSVMDDASPDVRLEAARALLETGDATGVPELIGGLRSPTWAVRKISHDTLKSASGSSFGYNADGAVASRDAAIQRYEAWYRNQG